MNNENEILLQRGEGGTWYANITIEMETKEACLHMERLLMTGRRMRWHKVEDELPPEDELVLAIVNGKWNNAEFHDAVMLAAYYGAEGWILEMYPEWTKAQVAYWMPLPELPEEVE